MPPKRTRSKSNTPKLNDDVDFSDLSLDSGPSIPKSLKNARKKKTSTSTGPQKTKNISKSKNTQTSQTSKSGETTQDVEINCCKSGWRKCKDGKWKKLIPLGFKRTIRVEDQGKTITKTIFIPRETGPSCVWISEERLREIQEQNRKKSKGNSPVAQRCENCNSFVPQNSINPDVCPKCRKCLISVDETQ